MKNEFIPYEQALALKELGFDEPCFGYYLAGNLLITNDDVYNSTAIPVIKAPTFSQAFRWFREKYNLQCWVETTGSKRYSCRYDGNDDTGKRWVGYLRDDLGNILFYNTYEEAELACLEKLIEIVKNK
jgi:hypothetical protein